MYVHSNHLVRPQWHWRHPMVEVMHAARVVPSLSIVHRMDHLPQAR
jgi:hypothetical protein